LSYVQIEALSSVLPPRSLRVTPDGGSGWFDLASDNSELGRSKGRRIGYDLRCDKVTAGRVSAHALPNGDRARIGGCK
jgi:hypothetical protein